MKFVVVLLAVTALAYCEDYEKVLQSPGMLMNVFTGFAAKQQRHYTVAEAPMRLRIFRKTLQSIVKGNKAHGDEWTLGLNKFSDMSQEEKERHLGLNMTLQNEEEEEVEEREWDSNPIAKRFYDQYLDWRLDGKVTGIKDQGGCGSCWAFAAVGAVEVNYAISTGRRKQFSEQEYLDCTYQATSGKDGCKGGWYTNAWDYSKNTGRLATQAAAPYTEKDGDCSYSSKHNGLMAAKISGYVNVKKGESNVVAQLNSGAVTVAFRVTDEFWEYDFGLINDMTCSTQKGPNHGVVAVGYLPGAMIIRNSWGSTWGDEGYFLTKRGTWGCGIYDWGRAPLFASTGKTDTDPEYIPTDDYEEECNGTTAEGCPCGTVRCGNGICKHAHMCKECVQGSTNSLCL